MSNQLQIFFHPDPVTPTTEAAVKEYEEIWQQQAENILNAINFVSGLTPKESQIHAIVRETISQAFPLTLRASYKPNTKVATVIHELLHRILHDYGIYDLSNRITEDRGLLSHKVLNLILYDIWVSLFGKDFADEQVAVEAGRTPMYKEAWDWALSKTSAERATIFSHLKSGIAAETIIT